MAESSRDNGSNRSATGKELTRGAKEVVQDLTGYSPEAVTGLQWDGESWLVTVDALELERVPNTTDVLGSYIAQLDDQGGWLGYKSDRRYQRGHAEES